MVLLVYEDIFETVDRKNKSNMVVEPFDTKQLEHWILLIIFDNFSVHIVEFDNDSIVLTYCPSMYKHFDHVDHRSLTDRSVCSYLKFFLLLLLWSFFIQINVKVEEKTCQLNRKRLGRETFYFLSLVFCSLREMNIKLTTLLYHCGCFFLNRTLIA